MKLTSVNVDFPRSRRGWKDRPDIDLEESGPGSSSCVHAEPGWRSTIGSYGPGGVDKAVYLYPGEHYSYWRTQLPGVDLPWGAFGENFSTEGILEEQVKVGDRLRIGSVEFAVTQPRMPCFKLGIRFDRRDMVKRFLESKRTGFYLAVLREGEVASGERLNSPRNRKAGSRSRRL